MRARDHFPILVAGIASALAGIFSMAAGEYTQQQEPARDLRGARSAASGRRSTERPGEAEAEIAYMLEEDGLPRVDAANVARLMASHPEVVLKTMVEKELGLAVEHSGHGSPLQGAVIMGIAFGVGAAVPLVPYLLLPLHGGATYTSMIATAAVLFGIGVVKSRWTRRSWIVSGSEILLLGAFAGVAGYFFGSVLPGLLGAPAGG